MKVSKSTIFYSILMLLVILVLWLISSLSTDATAPISNTTSLLSKVTQSFDTFLEFVHEHLTSQFGLLLAQIIIILFFARLVAWVFTKIGQPSVIGEILAGIILGPSVLGLLFPEAFQTLFPSESLHNISLLSQFGLILFMFVIGMELEISEIKKRFRKTLIISHAGIIIPFILGAVTALFLFEDYGAEGSDLFSFALFIGISMSITAFPVLARIIQEKGKMNSHIGILSLASAANGDITAWCLIAVIMAIAQAGSAMSALFTVLFALLYILAMFFLVRPLFRLVGKLYNNSEVLNKGVIAGIFLTLLISAYLTEILGLHALFGAFIAGVVMPENIKFRRLLTEKVEDVSLSIFLPLFFVSSGLQTQIGLLNSTTLWLITLGITLVAIIGKLGGTYIAARVTGESKYDSLYMGILMNTRGLMELVVLSMGYQLGILSPIIYAMLVLMTLVTTFMTTPLIDLTNKLWRTHKTQEASHDKQSKAMRILFSFGRNSMGVLMLDLVHTFFSSKGDSVETTAMHMTVGSDVNPMQAEHFREVSFAPIRIASQERGMTVSERYEVTDNPVQAIMQATISSGADLLLIGAPIDLSRLPEDEEISKLHRSVVGKVGYPFAKAGILFNMGRLLRDKTKFFIENTKDSVGVVIDGGLKGVAKRICIVHDHDAPEVEQYAHLVNGLLQYSEAEKAYIAIGNSKETGKTSLLYDTEVVHHQSLSGVLLEGYDLLLIPYKTFQKLSVSDPDLLSFIPTTLLLHSRRGVPFVKKP